MSGDWLGRGDNRQYFLAQKGTTQGGWSIYGFPVVDRRSTDEDPESILYWLTKTLEESLHPESPYCSLQDAIGDICPSSGTAELLQPFVLTEKDQLLAPGLWASPAEIRQGYTEDESPIDKSTQQTVAKVEAYLGGMPPVSIISDHTRGEEWLYKNAKGARNSRGHDWLDSHG